MNKDLRKFSWADSVPKFLGRKIIPGRVKNSLWPQISNTAQAENPLTATEKDMSPYNIILSDGAPENIKTFKGLSLSTSGKTLIDGNPGGNWFYSVGNSRTHKGGNPAIDMHRDKVEGYFDVASRTSLFTKRGKNSLMILARCSEFEPY